MTVTGPDVSHHQGVVDMAAVARAGHAFVGIKVSEGTGYRDPLFDRNRGNAVAAGLIRLLYHFCRPGRAATHDDSLAEARWFVRCIGTLQAGEVVVADIEDDKATGDLTAWTLTFLAEVDRLTGRADGSPNDDAVLYTYAPFARAHLRSRPAELADRHLWLAAYSNSPTVPAPWRSWTFWQHTSNGTCPGITGRCDLNRFSGPLAALQAIAGIPPAQPHQLPAPISTEEDAVNRTAPQVVAGHTGPWPNGRWTTITASPDGHVAIDDDVSALDGKSDFHFGDPASSGHHINGTIDGLTQLVTDGRMTGYVLHATDGGDFTYGTGKPLEGFA
jgi:GH25 family lysozyme M1 (1,4-beta-N-acetylmuramidase)